MTEETKQEEMIEFIGNAVAEISAALAFLDEKYDAFNGDEMVEILSCIDSYYSRLTKILADAEYWQEAIAGEVYEQNLDIIIKMPVTTQKMFVKSKSKDINRVVSLAKNALDGLAQRSRQLLTGISYQKENLRIVKRGY